ncbi:unnamed protein product, partial [Dovyalis caffra]
MVLAHKLSKEDSPALSIIKSKKRAIVCKSEFRGEYQALTQATSKRRKKDSMRMEEETEKVDAETERTFLWIVYILTYWRRYPNRHPLIAGKGEVEGSTDLDYTEKAQIHKSREFDHESFPDLLK